MDKISSFNTKIDVNGDFVDLKVSRKNHISDIKSDKINNNDKLTENFGAMFSKMIGDVNEMELKASDLATQMAVAPDTVNIHDVQIAGEQAEMGVLLTKGIIERIIRGYKEITNLR